MNSTDGWKFEFPNYVTEYTKISEESTITSRYTLSFIGYWLIRFIHGQEKLKDMSRKIKSHIL